jgi:alpha-galactosidase
VPVQFFTGFARLLLATLLLPLAACLVVKGGTVLPVIVSDSPAAADAYQIRNRPPLGVTDAPELKLELHWEGDHATATLRNDGQTAVPVHDVVLFDFAHKLPPDTQFYGEGFQMLSQTAGTIEKPVDLEQYTDRGHYKLPEPTGFRSVYGLAMFSRPDPSRLLVAFASCRRFVGRIDVSTTSIRAVIDGDGVAIEPGETWQLEDLVVASGPDRDELLARLAYWIERNHPRRPWPSPPRGWCSWYCFGPDVTAKNVIDNLEVIKNDLPELEYVQIDDGYQPAMGDWLETGKAFGGDVKSVIAEIKKRGLKPALWVAPFIASADSKLFREHPDWFVKGDDGKPLRSDKVGFGGWRQGPWYCLDGTNRQVQEHLTSLFKTLRQDWGVEYFKLDANYWGAIHSAKHSDPKATRVEAYRRGMAAIREAVGDSYILGCNHPMWGSLGLIDGSRSSMDIDRTWDSIARTGRQNLMRAWQNGRLWWNDPDCVLYSPQLQRNEVFFHLAVAFVTGGAVLSGDDLTAPRFTNDVRPFLRTVCEREPNRPAEISDDGTVARLTLGGSCLVCFFNPTDNEITRRIPPELFGPRQLALANSDIPVEAHSARLYLCREGSVQLFSKWFRPLVHAQ